MDQYPSPPPLGENKGRNSSTQYLLVVFYALFSVLILFGGLGKKGFWNNHTETQRAEVAREMVERNDWVVPYLNGQIFATKPPLGYWLMAASISSTKRVDEFAVRFPSAILSWLTGLALILIGWRLFGFWEGYLSGWILLTSPLWVNYSRLAGIDITMACLASIGILLLIPGLGSSLSDAEGQIQPASGKLSQTAYWMAGVILISLAVLAKGPPVLLIALIILGLGLVGKMPPLRWNTRKVVWGSLIVVAVFLPWLLLLAKRVPDILFLIRDEAIKNTFDVPESNQKPFYFYLETLIAFSPLIFFLPQAVREAFSKDEKMNPVQRILWPGLIGNILFFSLGFQKKHYYFLPLFPLLALLMGSYLGYWITDAQRWLRSRSNRFLYLAFLCLFLVLGVGLAGFTLILYRAIFLKTLLVFVLIALGLGVGYGGVKKTNGMMMASAVFAVMAILIGWNQWVFTPVLDPLRTRKQFLEDVDRYVGSRPLYLYEYSSYDAPFYLKRVIPEVQGKDLARLGPSGEQVFLLSMRRMDTDFSAPGFTVILNKIHQYPVQSQSPRSILLLSNRPD